MRWAVTIVLCCLVFSCNEVIDLNVADQGPLISVHAQFNNGTLGNKVELFRTSKNDKIAPRPISFARVRVYRRNGEFLTFREGAGDDERGIYLIEEHLFLGEVGEEYSLEVVLPTGEMYVSAWQEMPTKKAVDYLDAEVGMVNKVTETGQVFTFLGATIYYETEFLEEGTDVFLRWEVETSWLFREAILPGQFWFWNPKTCYMTDKFLEREARLFSNKDYSKNGIERDVLLVDRIDNTFFGKQYYSLIQSTINSDTYRFWSQVDQVANIKGSIFDPTFGPIISNIQNANDPEEIVVGYFEVNHVDTTHIELNQMNVDVELAQPCKVPVAVQSFPSSWFNRLDNYFLEECLNCLVIPNSSLTKPYFWSD